LKQGFFSVSHNMPHFDYDTAKIKKGGRDSKCDKKSSQSQ